jgi:hypothetical protein
LYHLPIALCKWEANNKAHLKNTIPYCESSTADKDRVRSGPFCRIQIRTFHHQIRTWFW